MEKIIEINGLTKTYKNSRGINNINLEIKKGDIFGFLGPNGSGKTTTMKIMTGLIKEYDGEIKLFGHSVRDDFEKAMEKVGAMVETSELFEYMTAYENLKQLSRYYKNIDDKRIDKVLELTGMLKYKNEKSKNFSLGMKQRLAISAAILSHPELVIMDEPLNGLDIEGMITMRNLIKDLAENQKTTFFISSHLIHDIELTCNKVGILYNGNMLGVDYTENILKNYDSLESYFMDEVSRNGSV